jgi:hypothetical protein
MSFIERFLESLATDKGEQKIGQQTDESRAAQYEIETHRHGS